MNFQHCNEVKSCEWEGVEVKTDSLIFMADVIRAVEHSVMNK